MVGCAARINSSGKMNTPDLEPNHGSATPAEVVRSLQRWCVTQLKESGEHVQLAQFEQLLELVNHRDPSIRRHAVELSEALPRDWLLEVLLQDVACLTPVRNELVPLCAAYEQL